MSFNNIIKVYKSDWKRIAKNPIAIIILIGLCVIPSLYAWVNIKACWNIYENTDTIPVAVVNNDKDAYYKDKKINFGDEIVDKLKKNHKIKWIFTNSREANLGIVDNTYYAIIEIPENFSSKFLTVLTDKPQKPKIIYKSNTKANAVASKITSTANDTLIEQISTEFIYTVNKIAFSHLNTIGDNAQENKDKIIRVKDSVININRNMNFITNTLQSIETNSDNMSEFLDSMGTSLPLVQSSLDSVGKSNYDNQQILKSMQKSMNNSLNDIDLNLNYIQISNTKVKNLFNSLNDSASSANSSKIDTILPVISTQLNSMNNSIDATIDYLKKCNSYDFNSDIDSAIKSLNKLKSELTNFKKTLAEFQSQLKKSSDSIDDMYDYLEKEIPQLKKDIESVDKSISSAIVQLENLNKTLKNEDIANVIDALKKIQTSGLKDGLITALEDINNSKDAVKEVCKSLDKTITTVIQQIDDVNNKIDVSIDLLQSKKMSNVDNKKEISNMINSLQNIKPYIISEQNQLSSVRKQLNSTNSISKKTLDIINNDSSKIGSQMNNVISTYNSSVKKDLENIVNSLMISMKDSTELMNHADDLITQMINMVNTAKKGSELASDVSSNLNKKLIEFKDVISALGNKFEQVNNNDITQIISILQNDPELMGDYVSNPFEIEQQSINKIPNYGSGMSPIYTTLALWVGCLVLNSLLKTRTDYFYGIENITLQEMHFGKMLLFCTLAAIQGLIVSLGDIFLLKIYVVDPAMFIFISLLSSIVFCIINFTLASTLGNVGKALSIIYLILQVAGSGGSYPIQVEPMVFRILQPLFPFTYTLGAYREVIAGPLISKVIMDIVALILFAVVFLVAGYFTIKPLNNVTNQLESGFKKSGLGE